MKEHLIFYSVVKKYFIELKRYFLNTLMTMGGIFILFMLVFFGLKSFEAGTDTLQGTIVGFAMWIFAVMAYSEMSWGLLREARDGTLEQLYLTPSTFRRISAYRVFGSFIFQFVLFLTFLSIMMVVTGQYLSLNPGVIILIVLTLMSIYGIGYIMGGLSLVLKKVQAGNQILQFLFILLLVLPTITDHKIIYFVPISWGNNMINRMMIDGLSLLDFTMIDYTILIVNSFAYLFVGLFIFSLMEKSAKKRGLLGHY
ncbi:MAG: hypothetical protein KGY66_03260 [Candidatus Thermoplasmatota archaeon]|nr:hypothetical protein [Candidatus Thermoplasmatota archaeon]